ncbi:tetratricopeptide repeat protein [Hyunsoonleella aestuarii]|uniref:Tetratricopeptide repeat protein n=1 Tax=Hyunsoonleella aestuarii TaxID=912802 RepID=A0ABP8E7N3_9FLAO|nr:tetratricopeptide repeat protein [Hyunsoonleella aestuarii]
MKKIFILLFALTPFLILGQAKKIYRQALRSTDLNEKIELLNQVIDIEPNNLDAYFHRALAKNDLGNYHGAIVDYSKIIIEEPDADTYFNRGNSRYNLEDFNGAKADYTKAVALDKNFVDAQYSLACAKYDLGEYERAIKDFDAVLKVIPDLQIAYTLRASAHAALENYKKALKDYSTAILVNPSSDAFYNRGLFYLDINYFQKANADFNLAIRLDRQNSFPYFYRGTTFLFLGKYKDAIEDYMINLKFDSLDFDALLGLAIAHYKIGDSDSAKAYFQKSKNILLDKANPDIPIEQFAASYWYLKQSMFFKSVFYDLNKL